MKHSTLALALSSFTLLSINSAAAAAPHVDLNVAITAPSVHVYETGTYSIRVSNTGNRNASGVQLVIDLPRTGTSPQVYLMGNLGPRDSRCTYAAQRLTCALGTINRNTSTTVAFDLRLPYSIGPLAITAAATSTGTANELTPANNSRVHTAQLALYPSSFAGGDAETRVCSGGTSLTSFFECELFPSSISSFESTLHGDGTITVVGEPGVTGAWELVGNDTLHIEYDDGFAIYTIDAKSVGGDCYEGRMDFGGGYIALHEVCIVP